MNITFTIPDDKISRVTAAFKGLHPIPSENNGTEDEPVMEPAYTDGAWAKKKIMDYIIHTVMRFEDAEAKRNAAVSSDDTLVS